jgi:hypothetical protein
MKRIAAAIGSRLRTQPRQADGENAGAYSEAGAAFRARSSGWNEEDCSGDGLCGSTQRIELLGRMHAADAAYSANLPDRNEENSRRDWLALKNSTSSI